MSVAVISLWHRLTRVQHNMVTASLSPQVWRHEAVNIVLYSAERHLLVRDCWVPTLFFPFPLAIRQLSPASSFPCPTPRTLHLVLPSPEPQRTCPVLP